MKPSRLAIVCLLFAFSTGAQTAKQHVNLGMTIDEFVTRFDVSQTATPEEASVNAAARDAMDGKRATIQMTLEGRKTIFLFEKRTLCEIDMTAGNTFTHELQVLKDQLGPSQVTTADLVIWDRHDGTRFTLVSRAGVGVLSITPTPVEPPVERE